jgi:hypothetical protein
MSRIIKNLTSVVCILLISVAALATADTVKVDNKHVSTWNKFANDILLLHKRIQKEKKLEVFTRTGGYFGNPDFYIEETYTDMSTGELVSRVLWERENPNNLHSIEVFVLDKQGRVIRDYAAAYLPTYRNAPTQTLVSFYAYNGDLEAYRTFDATGDRIGERCTGTLRGKEVNFILDEDEIAAALDGFSDRMEQTDYKSCFKGLREKPGKYITPQ